MNTWEEIRKRYIEPAAGKQVSQTVGGVAGKIASGAGDIYSYGVKQPTKATYQSIKQGSIKPMQQYFGNVEKAAKKSLRQNIQEPIKKIGDDIGNPFTSILDQFKSGLEKAQSKFEETVGPARTYEQKLNLISEASPAERPNLLSMIGQNVSPESIRSQIGQQYGAMGELARMREGSQRQSEQSALARRLAASGMGSSGAGMRLAQQTEQQAGRRAAETQLGLSAEQARAMQQAEQSAMEQNLRREGMRVGAAESEAERAFRERSYKDQQEMQAKEFEREGQVIAENQKIAREVQRYNERGLLGQLLGDLFGGGAWSMKYPLGQR